MALWFWNQIARRNSKYFPTLSAGPSDVLRGETHHLPQTAGDYNDQCQNVYDTKAFLKFNCNWQYHSFVVWLETKVTYFVLFLIFSNSWSISSFEYFSMFSGGAGESCGSSYSFPNNKCCQVERNKLISYLPVFSLNSFFISSTSTVFRAMSSLIFSCFSMSCLMKLDFLSILSARPTDRG